MATISENLIALQEAKANIKNAIESKGQDLTDVPFTEYADKISAISAGGGDDTETLKGVIEGTITELTIPSGTTKIAENRFYNDLTITKVNFPSSLKTISKSAFYNSKLTTLPDLSNVESIGQQAFASCKSLTEGKVLKNITYGTAVYASCSNLSSAIIEDGVEVLQASTFQSCSKLAEISIPNSVVEIDKNVFSGSGLASVTLPQNLTKIGSQAFYSTKITEITIPDTVTFLGNGALAYGILKTVNLGNGIETIEQNMFQYAKIESLTLPPKVTSIEQSICNGCTALTKVIVKGALTQIKASAFYGCKNVLKYDFTHCTQVPTLANVNAFNGINADCKIYVPDALYDTWITATNWTNYQSKIYKLSEMPNE